MAGTEDYSFYYSLENSPFWIKKPGSPEETNRRIQEWENKLIVSPKHGKGKWGKKSLLMIIGGKWLYIQI